MNLTTLILRIVLVILAVIFMPLLVIWSLNTLFGFTIAYNLSTWFAVVVLGMFIRGSCTSKK
jgi:inner membrane protein involved in colicin E2 resistance